MTTKKVVNQKVDVTALYFSKTKTGLKSYPKRIEYGGKSFTFIESGLQIIVSSGQKIVQLFQMTDGSSDYSLRHDVEQHVWTLTTITQN
jgi:hypothetical protein